MIGSVLGQLHFARGQEAVREQRWVQVCVGSEVFAAVDLAGCQKGEMVLLLTGESVRRISMDCPGDWAVAAVLSGTGNCG